MIDEKNTITAAKAMGGVTALSGFDYQSWSAIRRLPAWIADPSFEGLMFEGLEDFEARFFSAYSPHAHVIERFQAKNDTLTQSEIVKIFQGFSDFERASPGAARLQTLITSGLPQKLEWLPRDYNRLLSSRLFYQPFQEIGDGNDQKYAQDCVDTFGRDLGSVVAEQITVSLSRLDDLSHAEGIFQSHLSRSFPELEITIRQSQSAFAELNDLLMSSRGKFVTHRHIIERFRSVIPTFPSPQSVVKLHVLSAGDDIPSDKIVLDCREFSAVGSNPPTAEKWRKGLTEPLAKISLWANSGHFSRIELSGRFRLTSAFLIGNAFRSASGFNLDVPTQSGLWPTDAHNSVLPVGVAFQMHPARSLNNGVLTVTVGVLRDPSLTPSVLGLTDASSIESFFIPDPITSAFDVQGYLFNIKAALGDTIVRLRPTSINLFYVGPAAFVVALGHRWNALPSTQVFEFDSQLQVYKPSALV